MEHDNLIVHRKRVKGDDGYKTFSIRIREKTVAKIDEISLQTERSRNELIGILLDYALERCVVDMEQSTDK